jgi:ATP-dependent RNA helicase DeaD
MSVWLTRDRSKAEEDIATQLVAAGHDPIKVAAAALKIARADEKHRPIEKIGELRQSRSSKNSSQRNRGRANRKNWNKGKNGAHSAQSRAERDKTMVTLSLGRGREHGIGPAEIVGEIASRANIPGSGIGKILIQDKHTLVDIQEEFASRVLGQTGAYNLRGNRNVLVTKV